MTSGPTLSVLPGRPLLSRVATGDGDAMRECVARFGGIVWSMARRYAPTAAEDAAQEIFIDLWKSAGRYDPARSSEEAFVAMIGRRRLIDRVRRARTRPSLADSIDARELLADQDGGVGQAPDRLAEAALARRALGTLRPEQREVLVLNTCHGFSHDEIAQRTGMPLGTVKAHARRALRRVRATLLGTEVGSEDGSDGEGAP